MSATIFIGKAMHEFETLVSTNEYAHQLLAENKAYEGTLIRADYQSGGKGHAGNTWQSTAGQNLLVSIILKPHFLLPKRQFFLNQAVALATAETCTEFTADDQVKIKWPNDIMYQDKKIAGILIENAVKGNQLLHSVVGIGLNVNQQEFPGNLPHAVSLRMITGNRFDIRDVQAVLCEKTEQRYLQLKENRIEALEKDYMARLYRLDTECVFRSDGNRFNAKIAGITGEGKLILQTEKQHEVFGFKEVEMVI